jgi:hypothetical protein
LKTPNYLFSKYIRDNKLAFSCWIYLFNLWILKIKCNFRKN